VSARVESNYWEGAIQKLGSPSKAQPKHFEPLPQACESETTLARGAL
jgi:hypothetical protein